jgi:hypothetical protein
MKKLFIILLFFSSCILLAQVAGFGAAPPCAINACDPRFNDWADYESGVFWFRWATAYMVNNSNNDRKPYFITAAHTLHDTTEVSDTINAEVRFKYQSITPNNPLVEPEGVRFVATAVVRVKSNVNSTALLEFINDLPDVNVTFLGIDLTNTPPTNSIIFGHPIEDIKKGAFLEYFSQTLLSWRMKIKKGDGAMHHGSSGSPLIDNLGRVSGTLNSGTLFSCDDEYQSNVTFKKIGGDWNAFSPFLDPANTSFVVLEPLFEILPIELISLSANENGNNSVLLQWETATEVNNFGFMVERKIKDENDTWKNITFIEGAGNSNSKKLYKFEDKSLLGGTKFIYRLKQLDNDGTYTYSDEVEVEVFPTEYTLFQNYPNPFNPSTKIRFSIVEKQQVDLRLYNAIGQEVLILAKQVFVPGNHEVAFRADDLAGGVYFYRLQAWDFVETKKMVLLK